MEPKSRRARRTVPLIPIAIAVLHAQRARVLEARLRASGEWQEGGLVFPDEFGRPLGSHRVEHAFKRLIARAAMTVPGAFHLPDAPTPELARRAVEGLTPHTLRHSTATYLMAVGVPDRVVMEILGHGSLAVTSR